jgi:predicted Zn-dependent peptidase
LLAPFRHIHRKSLSPADCDRLVEEFKQLLVPPRKFFDELRRLVTSLEAQKELVNSISAFAYTPQDPGVFVFLASLQRDKINAATADLLAALARTRTELVSRAELTRARGNLESEFVYRKETMQGQARLLGYSQCVFEDPSYETRYLTELAAATARTSSGSPRRIFAPRTWWRSWSAPMPRASRKPSS